MSKSKSVNSGRVAVYHFEAAATNASVDAQKGVIYGVSLITSGITAKGHDLEVDHKTLEQMLTCAEAKRKIPVKWNHRTGADEVSGYIKNFRIEGRKLVGDWHLLKSHPRYEHALELASEMPECLGLSTSFRGDDEQVGEKKFARCSELVSADLVASPAANPDGFFEEKAAGGVDSAGNGMAEKSNTKGAAESSEKEFSLADVMAGITQINSRIDGIEQKVTSFEEFQQELVTAFGEGEGDGDGAEGEEGDPGAGEERAREFADAGEALHYLHERLSTIEDAKEQARLEHAFASYEERVNALLDLNEQLALENGALAEAVKDFSESTGRPIEFSAGAEGGYEHRILEQTEDGRTPTAFEARCKELEAGGKEPTEAIVLAMKENPGRYQKHLAELGVVRAL
jgi:hypothetical protein